MSGKYDKITEKIKAVVKDFFQESPELPAGEWREYSLADGTVVKIDKLEAGGLAQMLDGTPVPPGDFVMADGLVVTVGEDGIIMNVQNPEVEPTAPEEMPEEFNAKEAFESLKTELQTILSKFSEIAETEKQSAEAKEKELESIRSEFSEVKSSFEAYKKEAQNAVKELSSVMIEMCQTSTEEPITAPQSFRITESGNDKASRFLKRALKIKDN